MITKIEIVDENGFGTLLVGKEGLSIFFNRCRLTKQVKIEPSRLKKMIRDSTTAEKRILLDCDWKATFKLPADCGVYMGIKKDFPVKKPEQKKPYIFIEAWPSEYHMFPDRLLFEIKEVKNSLDLLGANSLQKRKTKVAQ